MKKIKVLSVFGTRPEAIKMASVVNLINDDIRFEQTVCVTAQHREMLDQVLNLFKIKPDIDLDLMQEGQTLSGLTVRMIEQMDRVIQNVKPDVVLLHGDTTTTMATSIAAFYNRTDIGHIEAGLRTGDLYSPWPEEFNRRVCDLVSRFYFAPTDASAVNLRDEGVAEDRIFVTGNTVIDALHEVSESLYKDEEIRNDLKQKFAYLDSSKKMILMTGHRRESFGDGFREICAAVRKIAERRDVEIVYPVHLNPNVKKVVNEHLHGIERIHLIGPLEYLPFVYLLGRAHIILTDSGGVQEEAPGLGKPVLVMRNVTERPEAIAAGTACLVGTSTPHIISKITQLLDFPEEYKKMSCAENPYGDGQASKRIRDVLLNSY